MRKLLIFCTLLSLTFGAAAQQDSVDVINYDIRLDIGKEMPSRMLGHTTLTLQLLRTCDTLTLDLKPATIDSICYDGERVQGFRQQGEHLYLSVADFVPLRPFRITVYYNKGASVEGYGWGGFHFDNAIHYNLGVAFEEYPHSFGRAWFPCRDNFTDKATYDITITTKAGWSALCSGIKQHSTTHDDGSETSVWRLGQPVSTYLVSVAAAPWHTIERTYVGHYSTYPATIGYTTHDSAEVYRAYEELEEVLPMFERCFGPYRWGRIGYVATPKGSMEHATNIGLVSSCMASMSSSCQSVIAHEFAHSWFGNLITCATSQDMWINEGGASFCEEIAVEATADKEAANQYYQSMLEGVLRTCHHVDGGYLSLHGVTPAHTYGNTSYHKGAMVWHSLRGYLGDSLFYSTMNRLFDQQAFTSIDAYQMRDTLSRYSGVDLTHFFNFHIFGTGFVDYHLDSLVVSGLYATVHLRQQLVGTDQYADGSRVPITFFSETLDTCKRWLYMDGEQGEETFLLPFEAQFAVIDCDKELSDAVTDDLITIATTNQRTLAQMHCKVKAQQLEGSATLHIAHHWTAPTTHDTPGIIRTANRYWTITGLLPTGNTLRGSFEYSRRQGANAADGFLDYGFYSKAATLDSIRLMYRGSSSEPWQAVSSVHTSDNMNGYFTTDNLMLGEYTLAVVDTALIGIAEREISTPIDVTIYPNPTADGTIKVEVQGMEERYTLNIFDSVGRTLLHKENLRGSNKIAHRLPKGSYILQLTTKQGTPFHTEPIIVH